MSPLALRQRRVRAQFRSTRRVMFYFISRNVFYIILVASGLYYILEWAGTVFMCISRLVVSDKV
jgi:hypothetical protein